MSRASQLGPSTQQAPLSGSLSPETPPSKRDLTSWWKQFKKNSRPKEEERVVSPTPSPVFGAPLDHSIKYANVAISLFDENGNSFIYGYVPIIVAKCGVFLKEKATDIEGIFRMAGAERRIRELQNTFNSPDRYGKGLDWNGYTVHDAANVLRRYLNNLPEPIIPLDSYDRFRNPIRNHQAQAVGQMDSQLPETGDFDPDDAIKIYQQLITELPPLNRQLLLYILDLLAVFASKSDVNLMTAANLAAIFQPGVLSHPQHDMAPKEYRLSQDVLIFLIEHQDNFIVGMQGTEMPKETIQEVQSGPPLSPKPPSSPSATNGKSNNAVGRSASTASAGAESVRRFGGVRRNVSVSSKRSRQSANSPSPVTPPPDSPLAISGVHRSNTLPSKKSQSPALLPGRFQTARDSTPSSPVPAPSVPTEAPAPPPETTTADKPVGDNLTVQTSQRNVSTSTTDSVNVSQSGRLSPHLRPAPDRSKDKFSTDMPPSPSGAVSPSATTPRERTFSNYFKLSPGVDTKDGRKPNKLQKKRPDQQGASAHSSTHSLTGASYPSSPAMQPVSSGVVGTTTTLEAEQPQVAPTSIPAYDGTSENAIPTQVTENTSESVVQDDDATVQHSTALRDLPQRSSEATTLKPNTTPPQTFLNAFETQPVESSQPVDEDPKGEDDKDKKGHKWRFSSHTKKSSKGDALSGTLGSSTLGTSNMADRSTSTVGSIGPETRPRKSFTDESQQTSSSNNAEMESSTDRNTGLSSEKRESKSSGPIGWFRGKLQERKEREAEKERAKSPSPPPFGREQLEPPPNMATIVGEKKGSVSSEASSPAQPTTSTETEVAPQTEASGEIK